MSRLCGLAQNRRLSEPEIQRASGLVKDIHRLETEREGFVQSHSLDADFCLPAGNFADDKMPAVYFRKVGRHFLKDPISFNWLRFLSFNFSGFSLGQNVRVLQMRTPITVESEIPSPDFDQRLPQMLPNNTLVPWWTTLVARTPYSMVYNPPKVCGEIGWEEAGGVIVHRDTIVYQERLTLLAELGLLNFLEERIAAQGVARVLEIGGGFGALARQLKHAVPHIAYTICDLPEAMYFSAPYLSFTLPYLTTQFVTDADTSISDPGVMNFAPNFALPVFAKDRSFDLVINTLSLSELSAHQVQVYGEFISRLIGGTGVFFEQNHDNTAAGMLDCKPILQRHFLHRTTFDRAAFPMSQGVVDVWSNRQLKLPYTKS